ncbi:MAG TPA: YceI family protein [Candidatus Nanopelagicales bacterium]|nr:YceI family protein [Candidatus Nanopelagicales bacterium]
MELTEGRLEIRTGVAGAASRAGHRLTLRVERWSATVELDGDEPVAVQFHADLTSLKVRSGSGGVTPLTPVDKQVIARNAAKTLEASSYPQVVFRGEVQPGYLVAGELTIHGVSKPLRAGIDVADGRARASIPVLQSDFGIKPYSLMLGQLRVADEVIVDLDVAVPADLI